MKKIAFILPYFGRFHNYFSLFLESCRYNSTIDWLIFTDDERRFDYPINTKVIYLSFDELKLRIVKTVGPNASLNKPYKLCDYKPAYGEIFKEYLVGYDYWGYCDCDLIFGDLRFFLTEDILERYNKLFTRGHFTLFHNDPITNSIYRTQSLIDWGGVSTCSQNKTFDEWNGISKVWDLLGLPYYDVLCMDDIVVGKKGLYPTKILSGHSSPYNNEQSPDESRKYKKMLSIVYAWRDGTLERCWRQSRHNQIFKEKIMYIHLQKRVMMVDTGLKLSNGFLITGNRFIEYDNLSFNNIKTISSNHFYFSNFVMTAKSLCKKTIKSIMGIER